MNPSHFSEALFTLGLELARLECYESRSPDGDGQVVCRPNMVSSEGQAHVTPVSPQAGDQGSKAQSDQQAVDAYLDTAGKPQTVSAGGRVTEQYEPQLRRQRPQAAGSEPADSHPVVAQTAAEASEGLVPTASNVSAADRVRNEQIVLQALRAWLGGPE
jgi:hypothetical protein